MDTSATRTGNTSILASYFSHTTAVACLDQTEVSWVADIKWRDEADRKTLSAAVVRGARSRWFEHQNRTIRRFFPVYTNDGK